MDAHSRRQAALDAIAAVRAGATARECESDWVDFKEERGTVDRFGARVPIDARDARAAQALAEEVACLANSDDGAVLVVGVDDKAAGPSAFVGAHLDTRWLRERIHALTTPSLSVDVIEERSECGRRIYLVNVAPALEEIRCGGKLRARLGDRCVELTGDRARELLDRRRNFDWTAQASGWRLSQAHPAALDAARRHYGEQRGIAPPTDNALVRRLGVALDDSDDPVLNRAGALLLCEFEPEIDRIDTIVTTVEGAPSTRRARHAAPLLTAFDSCWELLCSALPATREIVGAQRRSVRAIPEAAMREALVNALMHRDYRQPRGLVVAQLTGDPPMALKVRSPGGFPPGVRGDRLLATPSLPRNPALASALRALGLAELEGIGIDAMYRLMLRDGHAPPDIAEDAGDVVCRLVGGRADPAVRELFDGLAARDRLLGDDVRVYIAVMDLCARTPLRPERLATIAQTGGDEAFELLDRMATAGVVERVLNHSRSFRLTADAIGRLRGRIDYRVRQTLDEHWSLVDAYLDVHPAIGREDAATLLGLTPIRASNVLGRLFREHGRIEPVANARGRGVRYRRPAPTPPGRPGT